MRRALLIAPALLLVACGSTAATGNTTSRSPAVSTAPVAAAAAGPTIVAEADVKETVERGTPAVLLFMTPGCASCAATANAMTSAVGHRQVRLIGVDLSTSDDAGTLRSFLSDAQLGALPITWTIDKDGSLAQQYQVQAVSATVGVVGGAVRFTNQSAADADQLRPQIAGLG